MVVARARVWAATNALPKGRREILVDGPVPGPFIGAGGLLGTLEALEAHADASIMGTSDARRRWGWPHGGGYWWHDGQVRDQGAWVGVDPAADRVITVHAIGHIMGTADATALRLRRKHRNAEAH